MTCGRVGYGSTAVAAGIIVTFTAVLLAPAALGEPRAVPLSTNPGGTQLALLHATHGDQAAIVDSAGRQVLLRGVNLNSLGDYYQANPGYPPTVPVTDADWDSMAAQGFNVVRLIVSWSLLEPSPGVIDGAYVTRVRAAVDAAKARGMYTVIDMHQDAWGKYIASPPGVVCPPGRSPAIGWDGAPQWATLTDGADTCRGARREDSAAVKAAWDSFFADRDGIQSHLVGVWARLATELGAEPAVAGYDLLNEPNEGADPSSSGPRLGAFYQRAIAAIRTAEDTAGVAHHIAFFEPTVSGQLVPGGFTTDQNVVWAVHNYVESLFGGQIESFTKLLVDVGHGLYGTTVWFGEFGWFDDPAAQKPKVIRFGVQQDRFGVGGAWWQWRQACGDPHTIGTPGGSPPPVLIHYQRNLCPGDVNEGPVPEWRVVLSRPYPRAVPGHLTGLLSSGDAGTMALTADGADPGSTQEARTFEVWAPGAAPPVVGGTGIADVTLTALFGGTRVTGTICTPAYAVTIGPVPDNGGNSLPRNCLASPAPSSPAEVPAGSAPGAPASSSGSAQPVTAMPTFTG